jgi:uncharacterized protein (DUF924 family)
MSRGDYEKYVERLFSSGDSEQLSAAVDKAVVDFWISVLYVGFSHGGPINSQLSRHAIMHGGDVNYGSPAGSLKAILLLDLFQDAFRFTTVDGSPVYHAGDCVALAKAKGSVQFLKDEQEAIADGKRPCRRCL